MKIVIIGAGISGLATYLFLKKNLLQAENNISIKIYEAYDIHKLKFNVKPLSEAPNEEPVFTPAAIGSALGVGENGLKVLYRLDEDGTILGKVRTRGNSVPTWRMSNARGWTLARVGMSPQARTNKNKAGDAESEKDGMLMIARQDLWEVLRDEVAQDLDIIVTKRISKIDIGDTKTKSVIYFDDGTSDDADLVIGADGLRSILRRAMFEQPSSQQSVENQPQQNSSWFSSLWSNTPPGPIDYITPHYEGLGGLGGFIPTNELQRDSTFDPSQMNIVFGANGFFGYGCISSTPSSAVVTDPSPTSGTVSAWWSTFSSPDPYPYRQQHLPTPTSTSSPPEHTFNATLALKDLQTRHKSWKNPSIQRIISHAFSTGITSLQYYPTWTTPELPTWQQNGTAVLIGDAAHALQPSSGQGVSQALEDAESLVLLLRHYLSKHSDDQNRRHEAVSTALAKFVDLRIPRVHMVYDRAQRAGKMKGGMGFVMEMVMYFVIWVMTFFHDTHNDVLHNYDLPGEVEKIVKEDGGAVVEE